MKVGKPPVNHQEAKEDKEYQSEVAAAAEYNRQENLKVESR